MSGQADAGQGKLIDTILSVEAVRIFEPHPSVYRLAADAMDLSPHEMLPAVPGL